MFSVSMVILCLVTFEEKLTKHINLWEENHSTKTIF